MTRDKASPPRFAYERRAPSDSKTSTEQRDKLTTLGSQATYERSLWSLGEETIGAIASPAGSGAVGVLRLSGSDAAALLERASGAKATPRRMQRRVLCEPTSGQRVDEVLACYMPGPRSYTGEDVVEVFGHGGALNMEALLELFCSLGARRAQPGEFTRRAFLNGRVDLARAEAVAEVIDARSRRALENAQSLLAGALGRELAPLRDGLIALTAELEAAIDFADELDGAPPLAEEQRAFLARLRAPLERLIDSSSAASRLDGLTVALSGAVNVGKSSLFNALLARERALVSAEAGTTRDYLEADLEWRGLRLRLVDMAGERPEGEMGALERQGRRLASERLASCDVRLRLVDGSREVRSVVRDEGLELLVLTKADRPEAQAQRGAWEVALAPWGDAALWTSAQERLGLEALLERVVELGLPSVAEGETVVVTRRRQLDGLRRASAALGEGEAALAAGLPPELCVEHLELALEALGEVTGERFREDVLDAIFARFCIGK